MTCITCLKFFNTIMVLILDSRSDIGVLLICTMHLMILRAVTFSYFLHACATCSELPSNLGTMSEYNTV